MTTDRPENSVEPQKRTSCCKQGSGSCHAPKKAECTPPAAAAPAEVMPVDRRANAGDTPSPEAAKGPNRRESVVDRRAGLERRRGEESSASYSGPERRASEDRRDDSGLERRRGPGRRRSDDRKSAEEGEMNAEQFEFIMAIEMYKKVNRKIYPTWTEILEVIRQLGYRKVRAREVKLTDVPEAPIAA